MKGRYPLLPAFLFLFVAGPVLAEEAPTFPGSSPSIDADAIEEARREALTLFEASIRSHPHYRSLMQRARQWQARVPGLAGTLFYLGPLSSPASQISPVSPAGAGGAISPSKQTSPNLALIDALWQMPPQDQVFQPDPDSIGEWLSIQDEIEARYSNPDKATLENYVPSHGFATIAGNGYALWDFGTHDWGGDLTRPTLLFYAPQDGPAPVGVDQVLTLAFMGSILEALVPGLGWGTSLTMGLEMSDGTYTDQVPDPSYELIGWAYTNHYDPDHNHLVGKLPGVPEEAFFCHEGGWHNIVTGEMELVPPPEEPADRRGTQTIEEDPDFPGQVLRVELNGAIPDVWVWHERMWDLHVWIGQESPRFSINVPFDVLPPEELLLHLPENTFFYPAQRIDAVPAPGTP